MKTYDVVALGELLIDFTENGFSEQNNGMFEANPGGAPCNVLAMLRKFGKKTAFIGKVGQDMFGSLLKHTLEELEIDTSGLCIDEAVNTTLAFVHTAKNGDRDFSFYRNPGADMMLSESDLNRKLLTDCRLFHFGTLSMTNEVCRNATKTAVETAKNAGAFISFDPNIRETLWDDMEDAKIQTAYGMSQCDILKISDNEIKWFTSIQDYDKAAKYLYDKYNIPLILVSLGPDGSMAFYDNQCIYMPACHMENTIETTGAGDTFMGCILNYVLDHGLVLSDGQIYEMLQIANAAAAFITTRKGALRVMPEMEDIRRVVEATKNR